MWFLLPILDWINGSNNCGGDCLDTNRVDPEILVLASIYREAELIKPFLDSMKDQTLVPACVVIIDDGTPNISIQKEIEEWKKDNYSLCVEYIAKGAQKIKPNLDQVGEAYGYAWRWYYSKEDYDYITIFDPDSLPESEYFEKLARFMQNNPDYACVSGVLRTNGKERINFGARFGRKDARGCGKFVRGDFLRSIRISLFPSVAWDTFLNVRAKIAGFKAKQLDITYFKSRITTRVSGKSSFRNGRLTYHFGYNPMLVLLKMILLRRRALVFLRGYLDARKNKWRLKDAEVRKWFGWRFFLHPFR